jgi:disulfide bond formation protein DsbB
MRILGRRIDDRSAAIWAMWASAIALIAALGSQYLGGLAPCKLCIWQRIPHGITIVIGLGSLLWFRGPRERIFLTWLACLTFAAGAGIALYHTGVEQQWIAGPSSCSGLGALSQAITIEDLRAQLLAAPIVRCDEIPWSLFGVSIAGWNAVASLGLMVFCGTAAWNQTRRRYS